MRNNVANGDISVVRSLAERIAEIAVLPEQDEKRELWKRLNQLDSVRPMVHIYQIPWSEIEISESEHLALRCQDKLYQAVERDFRQTIWQWENCRGDMVVEPVIRKRPIIRDNSEGLQVKQHTIAQKGSSDSVHSDILSHGFVPQIKEEADIEKLSIPEIYYDEKATRNQTALLEEAFGDVLRIETHVQWGQYNIAPWDRLVQWTGVEQILLDLAIRPDYVHALMERLIQTYEARLDQLEALGLLSLNNNTRVGQGGLGYTDELPGDRYDPAHVTYKHMWGGGMAQIFSEVSPEMHREFALQYEARCLKRFGLVYYGCCEPLHHKMDIVREMLPNVRKVSMGPTVDPEIGAVAVGNSLVYSAKPNPAHLATDAWRPELVRNELRTILDATAREGCHVELVLKDISTVRCDPTRLTQWAEIAKELVETYAR